MALKRMTMIEAAREGELERERRAEDRKRYGPSEYELVGDASIGHPIRKDLSQLVGQIEHQIKARSNERLTAGKKAAATMRTRRLVLEVAERYELRLTDIPDAVRPKGWA